MTDPTPDSIHRYILETYPDTIVAAIEGGTFYSCDPANFPNFATVVTSDAFDDASNLSGPGRIRLNIGVSRDTFQKLVGTRRRPDYTALDQLMPHPIYARQHYVSVLNPSARTPSKTSSSRYSKRRTHERPPSTPGRETGRATRNAT